MHRVNDTAVCVPNVTSLIQCPASSYQVDFTYSIVVIHYGYMMRTHTKRISETNEGGKRMAAHNEDLAVNAVDVLHSLITRMTVKWMLDSLLPDFGWVIDSH